MATPNQTAWQPVKGLVLPPLGWKESPNQSDRLHGVTPFLVVLHRPVGSYESALRTLTTERGKDSVSAHILTEGKKAIQLVPWHRKSWTCATFNSVSYNIEADDNAWDGSDWDAFYNAAHITAWICHKTGIPPIWSRDPVNQPGVIRHIDLGAAGGDHRDPTTNIVLWRNFVRQVKHDVENTGWRRTWGRGRFEKLGV